MKIDKISSNQNFGMAIKIYDPHSAEVLKRRLKSERDIKKFAELVRSQENNEFNIDLKYIYCSNGKKLRGCIYDGRSFYREMDESSFSARFCNPLKFIKKLCDQADELLSKRHSSVIPK